MLFNIENTRVYGLRDSIRKSGFPKRTVLINRLGLREQDMKRAETLGNAKIGSGHDNYLKGVTVQFDINAPLYMWKQIQRYGHFDIVSSQSTMHMIMEFDLGAQCNPNVFPATIVGVNRLITQYKHLKETEGTKEQLEFLFLKIVNNLPSGFHLTAGITTNYLQLKTMYNQRKGHKLPEWLEFCNWCETLPQFKTLALKKHTI